MLWNGPQYSHNTMAAATSTSEARVMPKSRRYAILLAGLLLGVPIAAVGLRASDNMRRPLSLQAASPRAPSTTDISVLEAVARSEPTMNNRLNLSVGYINADALDRAIPILMSLIAEDKNNARAWNNLCVADNLQRRFNDGLEACTEALRIDPNFQLAANNLRWAMREQELEERPRAEATPPKQALGAGPDRNSTFYLDLGLRQLNAGDYDAAIASWQAMLAFDPANALALNNIGTAYMFKKDPRTALEWFQRAVKSDPSLQIAKNNLAWAANEQAKTHH